MIQQWYNKILNISGGMFLTGFLIGLPVMTFVVENKMIADIFSFMIFIGGFMSLLLIIVGIFSGHYARWINTAI